MTIINSAFFFLALASSSSALEGNAPQQPQSLTNTICAGRPRSQCEVELDVPSVCANSGGINDPSCPIVFFLHGSGGTNNWFKVTSGVHDAGYIGVYPQGEGGWNTGPKSDNDCDPYDYDCPDDPDEGDFIASIIANIRDQGGTGNVYAYGNSNGAALAHRLASNGGTDLPIKGIIVSVTQLLASPERSGPGSLNYNQPSSSRGTPAVSILSIMGTSDGLIPYDGGWSSVFNDYDSFQLMPTLVSMSTWASHDGCDGSYQTSEHTTDQGDYTATKYDYSSGCPSGILIEHYAIHGGGHGAGGASIDGAKVDVLGFVARVEAGGIDDNIDDAIDNVIDDAMGDDFDDDDDIGDTDDSLSCMNDSTWSGKFNTAHTCDYVAEDPTNRCGFQSSNGISADEACPEACDDECSLPPVYPPSLPPSTDDYIDDYIDDDNVIDDAIDNVIDDAMGDDFEDDDDIGDTDDSLSCMNDSTWSGKFNTAHTCDYVAEDPTNRCGFQSSNGISADEACPFACNAECGGLVRRRRNLRRRRF